MFDVQQEQRKMNALKQVPIGVAITLADHATAVLANAQKLALTRSLPGAAARDIVAGKLQWHEQQLMGKLNDDPTIYASGDDLKKWCMQAFIEANAVEEGSAYLDGAWAAMWSEIGTKLAALPAAVAAAVGDTVQSAVTSLVPMPVLIGGGITVVALLALYVWRVTR